MRLDHVAIEDFRGIDRLAVGLESLTTVIGEPHCGKSSLLRAVGRVLGPRDPGMLPRFSTSDFHRPRLDDETRASTLSISLGLRSDGEDDEMAERLPGVGDGGVSLRVTAQRVGDEQPATTVEVVDRASVAMEGVDALAVLAALRRKHPAVIVGGPRAAIERASRDPERGGSRLRSLLLGAAEPREPLTWDQLVDVQEDLVQVGGRLAEQLGPAAERRRSVREMTDTPRPLVTDLASAMEEDAGSLRRIAALWLLVAILDALPEEGIGIDAEPILLFDDIEANLHPTWLAALCAVAFNLPFQSVVATHSPEVLAWVPLSSLRRLDRQGACIEAHSVQGGHYSDDELRRVAYHLRLNRGGSFFARCWILVEGETEAWLIPEFALHAGVEFPVEGIRIIEFAQCGISPLLKIADDLGISWLLLADGDQAGQNYARTARKHLDGGGAGEVVLLPARDIEHYLFKNGYGGIIRKASGSSTRSAGKAIHGAVERVSKPGLALEILAEADRRGPEGVPPIIREVAETAARLARG